MRDCPSRSSTASWRRTWPSRRSLYPPPSPNTLASEHDSPSTWISAGPAPLPWCGGLPRLSNSGSATRCCVHCPLATSRRCPARSPRRMATHCISDRRATNMALPKRNSRFPTATSAKTDPTVRWPSATPLSTATTNARWQNSSSTRASTPTTPTARFGKTSRSPSRTCWPVR